MYIKKESILGIILLSFFAINHTKSPRYNEFAQVLVHNATTHDPEKNITADQSLTFDELLTHGFRGFKLPLHPASAYGKGTTDDIWVAHILSKGETQGIISNAQKYLVDWLPLPASWLEPEKNLIKDTVNDLMWNEIDPTKIRLSSILKKIKLFLATNPSAIITLVLNVFDMPVETLWKVFLDAKIDQYIHEQDIAQLWPTLLEIVKSDKRLIVFVDDTVPENIPFLEESKWIVDNEYVYNSYNALTTTPCKVNWETDHKKAQNKLFKLNHFITSGAAGSQELALAANSYESIMKSVNSCISTKNSHYPNFIHLDFVDQNLAEIKKALTEINTNFKSSIEGTKKKLTIKQ